MPVATRLLTASRHIATRKAMNGMLAATRSANMYVKGLLLIIGAHPCNPFPAFTLQAKVPHHHRIPLTPGYPAHTPIAMPALSPTMTSGNIGEWHKKVGDAIAPGDVLVEIETDKAQMDFECQEEGFLAKIIVPSNTKDVAVNKVLYAVVER